jgi:hypothetical protein
LILRNAGAYRQGCKKSVRIFSEVLSDKPERTCERGVVRLTNHELASQRRSRLSRRELTPLGQGGRAVLFEDVARVEVAVVVEVVVD